MTLVEIKDFNALSNNKPCFGPPVKKQKKKKQKAFEKPIEVSRNNGYRTGNLLDYLFHKNYYKLIRIDLSGQRKTCILQQINFTGKLQGNDRTKIFFIAEKQQKTILSFSLASLIV